MLTHKSVFQVIKVMIHNKCISCTESQLLGIFPKQTCFKVLLSWYFIVKKHKMWPFTIKFGELRYKNIDTIFMIKRDFTLKSSQLHTRLASLALASFVRMSIGYGFSDPPQFNLFPPPQKIYMIYMMRNNVFTARFYYG